MKVFIKLMYFYMSVFLCCALLNVSCKYDEIADAPYPDSLIYLPIAVEGSISPSNIYSIVDGASTSWVSPTPGQPIKYDVKKADNQFIIPLGVYRSGYEDKLSKAVTVHLSLNQDTVLRLINEGKLPDTEPFPMEKIQIPTAVSIEKGKNNMLFDLIADLSFLRSGAPKLYAIGISISSNDGEVNTELNTGIILINTQITIPVADYAAQLKGSSVDTYSFTNTSLYWDYFSGEFAFIWDFGDGSPASNVINPQHTYAAVGEYNVTLTVKGITGESVAVVKKVSVN